MKNFSPHFNSADMARVEIAEAIMFLIRRVNLKYSEKIRKKIFSAKNKITETKPMGRAISSGLLSKVLCHAVFYRIGFMMKYFTKRAVTEHNKTHRRKRQSIYAHINPFHNIMMK